MECKYFCKKKKISTHHSGTYTHNDLHIICGHRNGLPAFCEKACLRRKVLSLVLNSEWDYFADQQAANSRQMEQQNWTGSSALKRITSKGVLCLGCALCVAVLSLEWEWFCVGNRSCGCCMGRNGGSIHGCFMLGMVDVSVSGTTGPCVKAPLVCFRSATVLTTPPLPLTASRCPKPCMLGEFQCRHPLLTTCLFLTCLSLHISVPGGC